MSNDKSNIFSISDRARQARAQGLDVIDGTVGMFLNAEGNLSKLPIVESMMKSLSDLDLAYPPVGGYPLFLENTLEWLLGEERLKKAKKNMNIKGFASLGGTGALYLAFKYAQSENYELLMPGIGWTNYPAIVKASGIHSKPYSMFDQRGNFNLESIKNNILKDDKKFRGFLILVNDPCQNPTGYTMSDKECQDLYKMLDGLTNREKTHITVLWDAAYIDFTSKSPAWLDLCVEKQGKVETQIAVSASKSFGLYGLRTGALYHFVDKDKPEKKDLFTSLMQDQAYGIYSVPSSAGMYVVNQLLKPENKEETRKEIKAWQTELKERSTKAIEALKANNIPFLPYKEGFYLVVKTPVDSIQVCQELEKKNIYLAPLPLNMVRVSIASIALNQIESLAKALKETFNSLKPAK